MGNCCNDHHKHHHHHVDKYINLSRLKPKPWEDVPLIVGMTECGKVVIVDKPLYELSEDDRKKLDSILLDGKGTMFLSDDGSYKSINLDDIPNIILKYYENPANFVIGNLGKINEIRSLLDEGQETFVRIDFGNYVLPVHVGYSETQLIFEFDQIVLSTPLARELTKSDNPYLRLKLVIVLDTLGETPTVVHYEVRKGVDSDDVLLIDGDGESALFNDGAYKATYTKEQIDILITTYLAEYYTQEEINGILGNYYTKEEIDNSIVENNENYYTKEEIDETLDNYYTKEESDANLVTAIQDAVFYDDSHDIHARKDIYLANNSDLRGLATNNGVHHIAGISAENTVQIGSEGLPLQISSSIRPEVNDEKVAYLSDIDKSKSDLQSNIDDLQNQIDEVNAEFQEHVEEYISFNNMVCDSLDGLDKRASDNEVNIGKNLIEIDKLRDDLAQRELFRGYFLTTNEVTEIKNPVEGNYAWNAETGTVWYYNSTTWSDTGKIIPDQTIEAFTGTPSMDGEANPGSTNQYARGDHKHPVDISRAAVADLELYYKKTEANDLLDDALKNAVRYDENDDIRARKDIYLPNDNALMGASANGGVHPVASVTSGDMVNLGNDSLKLNIDSHRRPTVNSTESVAYISDIAAAKTDILSDMEGVQNGLQEQIDQTNLDVQEHVDEYNAFGITINAAIDTISTSLEDLDDRIIRNKSGIKENKDEIAALREDLAARELFRGYFLSTDEVTEIKNPETGNYAWNAETGTVWYYNGSTWGNTGDIIPDQTVEAFAGTPLMDGDAHPGYTNQYARGDHQHPTDESRASQTDLEENYYTKDEINEHFAGNNANYYTKGEIDETLDEYYKKDDADSNLAKAIGDAVFYDENDNIQVRKDIYLANDNSLLGKASNNGVHHVAGITVDDIVFLGSERLSLNIESQDRPSVNSDELVAYVSDVEGANAVLQSAIDAIGSEIDRVETELQGQIDQANGELAEHADKFKTFSEVVNSTLSTIDDSIFGLDERVTINESNIESLRGDLAEKELFRGYYLTTNEVTSIRKPEAGNYAWNAETGTVWCYDGTTWADSGDLIPDQTVEAFTGTPLMDGEASAGFTNQYARGDHQHPTDDTRASITYVVENYYTKDEIDTNLSGNYESFYTKDETNEKISSAVDELDQKIGENTVNIQKNKYAVDALREDLAARELFRGYYLTTDEVTAILNPVDGNYAWNAETGTVWYYNDITWANTGNIIPDQTVEAFTGTPSMDGDANPGSSNQYARGDHQHPTDLSRAAATDLDNYLPLAGNTQASPMGGSIWLGSGNAVYVTNSGKSYLQQETNTHTTILNGDGIGGIDLTSTNGMVKANGQQILVNGENSSPVEITASKVRLTGGDTFPSSVSMAGGEMQLAASTFTGIFLDGASIESSVGDIVLNPVAGELYYGNSSSPLNEIATKGDIESADYLPLTGGSLSGDLTVKGGNITVDANQSVRFSGNGAVRMEHSEENSQLNIIATTTTKGIDVATNPSVPSSIFTYNGVEVATVEHVYQLQPCTFEAEIEDSNIILLPHIPYKIIAIYFERVILYENEYSITGTGISLLSEDIDISGVNKVKVVYTTKEQ